MYLHTEKHHNNNTATALNNSKARVCGDWESMGKP